jgi:dTMP kinase
VLEDTAIAGGGAFVRDVARGVDASWVRNLYRFAVRPTIGFYFRISVEEALRRVVGGRDAISYYEAGMDHTHIDDTEESFRVFQSCVIDEYDSMVDEFGLVVIDARQSIEDQQVQMREAVAQTLAGASKMEPRA